MSKKEVFVPGLDENDVIVSTIDIMHAEEIVETTVYSAIDSAPINAATLPPADSVEVDVKVDPSKTDETMVIDDDTATDVSASILHSADDYRSKTTRVSQPCKGIAAENTVDINTALTLPMRTRADVDKILEDMPVIDPTASKELEEWATAFNGTTDYYVRGHSFDATLEREGSQWRQEVEGENNLKLKALAVTHNTASLAGATISGEQALSILNKKLNLGSNIAVPLWHSGIWITLRAPSSGQLIAIDRLLSDEKIILGRQTNGLVFSNVSVYLRRALVDLALTCVYDASVENFNRELLLDIIRVTDYNALILALGCAMYPNGYSLAQPCADNPARCTHVTKETLSLPKLAWTDTSALTEMQRKFMSDRGTIKKSVTDIKIYQSEGVWNNHDRIKLNDSVYMVNRVPSIREDIRAGVRWVDSVVEDVRELYDETILADEDVLNTRIAEQSRASTLRQYDSWIDRYVIIDDNDNNNEITITDRETIERTCERLTVDSTILGKAFTGIGSFIDSSTISLIGIPNYACPACQTHLVDPEDHPKIIPLSIDELFFTLMRQTTLRVIGKHYTF